jgi:hypothetical protein
VLAKRNAPFGALRAFLREIVLLSYVDKYLHAPLDFPVFLLNLPQMCD